MLRVRRMPRLAVVHRTRYRILRNGRRMKVGKHRSGLLRFARYDSFLRVVHTCMQRYKRCLGVKFTYLVNIIPTQFSTCGVIDRDLTKLSTRLIVKSPKIISGASQFLRSRNPFLSSPREEGTDCVYFRSFSPSARLHALAFILPRLTSQGGSFRTPSSQSKSLTVPHPTSPIAKSSVLSMY